MTTKDDLKVDDRGWRIEDGGSTLDPPSSIPRPRPSTLGRRWSPGSLLGLFQIVGRRLWSHLALMLAIAAGFVVAIALVVSIPVFAEAVGYRVLRDELSRTENGGTRPPFAFMYRYLGSQYGLIDEAQYAKVDAYMRDTVAQRLGLPVQLRARYVASDKLPLLPSNGAGAPLLYVNMIFFTDIEQHVELADGRLPQTRPDGPVEVLITEALASKLGFQVGEEYLVLGPKSDPAGKSVPVRIAGVWRAKDPNDPFWFYRPDAFDEALLMPEASYTTRVASRNPESIYVALWYLVTDGSGIRSADVPAVSTRIARTNVETGALLTGARLEISPAEALGRHQAQVRRLTLVLTIFSIPILGLIAYFVILVAGLIVQRQSNEIAVLRSRGASRSQVLGVYLLEGALVGLVALALAQPLGAAAAFLMTWTRSFLDLAPIEPLPIVLTDEARRRGVQMFGLLLLASMLPALGVARYTVVSYKAERARATRRPFWQRAFLDLLLLAPAYYAYTQLKQRGTIALPGISGPAGDPFANPLLLLAPSLYMFALALLAVRLFPLLMRLLAWAFSWLPGVAAITALRYLARTPRAYTGPVLLLILTLSLATFTASMARTLDGHLLDRVYYEVGADMRLADLGQSLDPNQSPLQVGVAAQPQPQDTLNEAKFLFLPVSDYLGISGVAAATRVVRTTASANVGGNSQDVQFLGLDRAEFAGVARWRDDYAGESLGALMNRLADDPAAVLVSSDFASRRGLRVGDRLTLTLSDLDAPRQMPAVIAGFVGLFPTVYPDDGPLVIGNLDYVFEQEGGQFPYEVWLRLRDGANRKTIIDGVSELSLRTFDQGYAPEEIALEWERPERQGVFGLLSAGFVAAAFLTLLGFLFYAVLSFQRRFVELGMLRAIGLSARQLGALLTYEQALIIGAGMLAGTLIGVSASTLFIPFLQVRGGEHPLTPPFQVWIAWEQIGIIYLVFGAILAGAVVLTLILLRRMQLFQAVKLGEAI
jgi:putative ABC transport system permease protein